MPHRSRLRAHRTLPEVGIAVRLEPAGVDQRAELAQRPQALLRVRLADELEALFDDRAGVVQQVLQHHGQEASVLRRRLRVETPLDGADPALDRLGLRDLRAEARRHLRATGGAGRPERRIGQGTHRAVHVAHDVDEVRVGEELDQLREVARVLPGGVDEVPRRASDLAGDRLRPGGGEGPGARRIDAERGRVVRERVGAHLGQPAGRACPSSRRAG